MIAAGWLGCQEQCEIYTTVVALNSDDFESVLEGSAMDVDFAQVDYPELNRRAQRDAVSHTVKRAIAENTEDIYMDAINRAFEIFAKEIGSNKKLVRSVFHTTSFINAYTRLYDETLFQSIEKYPYFNDHLSQQMVVLVESACRYAVQNEDTAACIKFLAKFKTNYHLFTDIDKLWYTLCCKIRKDKDSVKSIINCVGGLSTVPKTRALLARLAVNYKI